MFECAERHQPAADTDKDDTHTNGAGAHHEEQAVGPNGGHGYSRPRMMVGSSSSSGIGQALPRMKRHMSGLPENEVGILGRLNRGASRKLSSRASDNARGRALLGV